MSKFKDYIIEQQEEFYEQNWATQDEYDMLDDYEYPDTEAEEFNPLFNIELDEELPF